MQIATIFLMKHFPHFRTEHIELVELQLFNYFRGNYRMAGVDQCLNGNLCQQLAPFDMDTRAPIAFF